MSVGLQSGGFAGGIDHTIAGRIDQLRQLQAELSSKPVTGKLKSLRKLIYQAIRSAFSRQYKVNAATVDLIETVYREMEQQRKPVAPLASGQVLSSAGQVQDQAALNGIRPLTGFQQVYTSPAELRMPERVALYGLVFSLQPRNCLEIGTFRGGSTAIICGAMDDTGFGQLACVDPTPLVAPELWSQLCHRCRMHQGFSPAILPQVARESGAPFDFAWIDGNHTYEGLQADIDGVLPLLADSAYLLFHDAHYTGVKQAIDEAVAKTSQLVDCGLISVEPTVLTDNGQTTTWAGMRLLRFQR